VVITGFGDVIAERMKAEHATLAARWFERLAALLPVDATEVFPTASLLDHVPALIVEIGEYVRVTDEAIAANTAVVDKARQLGALRHGQRASLHQVLREYQILGGVLVSFVQEETARLNLTPPAGESVAVVSRLHQAVNLLTQETVETFVSLYTRTIELQTQRLEQFARMAAHEWRQPLGSLQFALSLLRQAELEPQRANRTLEIMERNIAHLVDLTRKIEALSRLSDRKEDPVLQHVSLTTVAGEAARQLRDMAEAREVELRIARDLPDLVVDVGRLELALVNLLSNSIKYADPDKSPRFAEVVATTTADHRCVLVVRDNGIGIPPEHVDAIFERYSRAHADRDDALMVTGLGLGLSIVADCVQALAGTIEVKSAVGQGTTFVITLPVRAAHRGLADPS
jgi:signal transduction histidine kinase